MLTLYPSIKPYQRHSLSVDETHTLYFDESGNPEGIPVIFLHDGPGYGCDSDSRRYCNPELYRIIILDQRGCGRSMPHGELENNTTEHLIKDIEAIREHLNINRWVLLGCGWGGTLALLYAIQHPDNVLAMVLAGISLGRQRDLDWIYRHGTRHIFPDAWQKFIELLSTDERSSPLTAYHERLVHSNELTRMSAAKEWGLWIMHCATLRPGQEAMNWYRKSHHALAMARISAHFAVNNFFLENDEIINGVSMIEHIPGVLVHGRYDMLNPLEGAFLLHRHWPASTCNIIRDAGHLLTEPGIQDACIRAIDDIGRQFKNEFKLDTIS